MVRYGKFSIYDTILYIFLLFGEDAKNSSPVTCLESKRKFNERKKLQSLASFAVSLHIAIYPMNADHENDLSLLFGDERRTTNVPSLGPIQDYLPLYYRT